MHALYEVMGLDRRHCLLAIHFSQDSVSSIASVARSNASRGYGPSHCAQDRRGSGKLCKVIMRNVLLGVYSIQSSRHCDGHLWKYTDRNGDSPEIAAATGGEDLGGEGGLNSWVDILKMKNDTYRCDIILWMIL